MHFQGSCFQHFSVQASVLGPSPVSGHTVMIWVPDGKEATDFWTFLCLVFEWLPLTIYVIKELDWLLDVFGVY